ncbi:predicted protein [Streptomyces viridosporus ATCC 14672]|uniref:Predicted protein n=1 Tax=Streptomyces viridosporus (strain ATCC 14672 / DSM 40746 / JCM 4963 / KCTC 9882 / NRRL B-12104 / FH 1290) TaxID=566461 RepID=D5ZRP0_STRV1|nr:predicted protein [Streptomyces viridosporus ATCC 14672]
MLPSRAPTRASLRYPRPLKREAVHGADVDVAVSLDAPREPHGAPVILRTSLLWRRARHALESAGSTISSWGGIRTSTSSP